MPESCLLGPGFLKCSCCLCCCGNQDLWSEIKRVLPTVSLWSWDGNFVLVARLWVTPVLDNGCDNVCLGNWGKMEGKEVALLLRLPSMGGSKVFNFSDFIGFGALPLRSVWERLPSGK